MRECARKRDGRLFVQIGSVCHKRCPPIRVRDVHVAVVFVLRVSVFFVQPAAPGNELAQPEGHDAGSTRPSRVDVYLASLCLLVYHKHPRYVVQGLVV